MIYLALSIAASTAILIVFRWMQHNGANTRHAITLNYLVAAATGVILFAPPLSVVTAPWFWPAALEGVAFYLIFRIMARTTQVSGVLAAGIATRMSVVIPVGFGLFLLHEQISVIKLFGVAAGLCAVFLAAGQGDRMQDWKWPLLAFVSTGLLDASLKLFQVWSVTEDQFPGFLTTIYAFAFAVGVVHHSITDDKRVKAISVVSGLVLGTLNFGSLFFIMQALALPNWESSIVFPINNFGIVALATLSAVVLFGERLTPRGWFGLSLATVSIGLLYLSA